MSGPTDLAPLAGKRILVTGATGFIGGPLVARLEQAGAEVHGLARSRDPRTTEKTKVSWHRADLTDREATAAVVGAVRPHQIVHLASLVSGSRDPAMIVPMFEANTTSTVHLLDAAAVHGVKRIHLAGSLEEPDDGRVPSSPYAAAKTAAHLYGDFYRDFTDLDVVSLQIFMVYGPAQRDEAKLIPYVINTLLDGRSPEIGAGTRPVDWVHVNDVAEAILRCCTVGPPPDRPVPIGTGELHTVREVVNRLVSIVGTGGSARFGARPDRGREEIKRADVALTGELLGWHPSITIDDGLAATVDWYRRQRKAGSVQ